MIPFVVEQHADEFARLWTTRDSLRAAVHVRLGDLARFDDRIAANQDACLIAGELGLQLLVKQLSDLSAGRLFAAATTALDLNDRDTLGRCLAIAEAEPPVRRGMKSALGWVEPPKLKGIVRELLESTSAIRRSLGLAACRLHGVDPGEALAAGLTDPDPDVQSEASRTAAALGKSDHAARLARLAPEDPSAQFWWAWSSVLLGNRGDALDTLTALSLSPGSNHPLAFQLALQAMNIVKAHEILRTLASDATKRRMLIEAIGIVGDPGYVPWLMKQMSQRTFARIAGDAFTLITGADLAAMNLRRDPDERFLQVPTEDPELDNVETDPDDELSWPDPERIEQWWLDNAARFTSGTRYFLGAPVTRKHCVMVLNNGLQHHRRAAARHLCLLEPGTPLLNTSAPVRRQRAALTKL